MHAQVQVGIYGMDVYSMHTSADAVVGVLRERMPELAQQVENRYRCFDK